jgi:hypothetical protein
MALGFWLTAVDKVSRERHKNYLPTSDLPRQAVPQEHDEAICQSGIRRRRCNVSSKPRATKLSLPSSSKLNMTIQFLRYGISRHEQARDVDLVTAVFRNRVINPDQYDDDEQIQVNARATTIPVRTKRRWRQWYRDAENQYGSGFIGLLPHFARSGRKREAGSESSQLIHQVLETHYDTVTRKPKRGAHGEYLELAEEQQLTPLSPRTFYREIERHKSCD